MSSPLRKKTKVDYNRRKKVLLATVKGDVHDIGKNIVGVVLSCNNYEIIDLGVMVQCDEIIQRAIEEQVDVIGLSGLITPSLDEMVFVAKRMAKAGLNVPLLIGGATTSRIHTAVKISPVYSTLDHPVVYVLDASRSVVVVNQLVQENQNERTDYVEEILEEYEEIREEYYESLEDRATIPYSKAKTFQPKVQFKQYVPCRPMKIGRHVLEGIPIEEVLPFIDWNPFFSTWELRGRYPNRGYPKIFNDKTVGEEAQKLFHEAQLLLKEVILPGKVFELRGVYGVFPARRNDEDIGLYNESGELEETLHTMRQQTLIENDEQRCYSLCDFIASSDELNEEESTDYLGMFAVACFGVEELGKQYEKNNDDYRKIMAQALGDRLVEAFAEYVHYKMRTDSAFWGYHPHEKQFQLEECLRGNYPGIRPAPGYPSQPDHTEKLTMWNLLQPEKLGLQLTSSLAMLPAASVSALCFAHPESQYFAVGKIGKDQVEDYALRKGIVVEEVEKWLGPNLAYHT